MSENTITIEGKNGIMLIEGIDYILNMKKGSITITREGFSKFPAIIMVPYKSESHHKRKGNYYHCKGTGNAEETINVDDIQEHWKCAETPPKGDPIVHMY